MSDFEVATYVLAYLMKENFSQTANTLLHECSILSSVSPLILPATSLHEIIAQHKARKANGVLVSTLGAASACQQLWSKLEQTLEQLKSYCIEGGLPKGSGSSGISRMRKLKTLVGTSSAASKLSNPSPPPKPLKTTELPYPIHQPQGMSILNQQHLSQQFVPQPSSPRRKKQAPKRKGQVLQQPHSSHIQSDPCTSLPSSDITSTTILPNEINPNAGDVVMVAGGSSSPTMLHVLETFLEDDTLPDKLADIINRCVSNEDVSDQREQSVTSDLPSEALNPDLSSDTLENILSMTWAEPAFEGVLQPHPSISKDADIRPKGRPVEMRILPTTSSNSGHHIGIPIKASHSAMHSGDSTSASADSTQLNKKLKLDDGNVDDSSIAFPSEQDIEKFLDKIHQ